MKIENYKTAGELISKLRLNEEKLKKLERMEKNKKIITIQYIENGNYEQAFVSDIEDKDHEALIIQIVGMIEDLYINKINELNNKIKEL